MSLAALIVTVATDCEITRHKSLRVGAGKDALMDRREFDERLGSAAQKLASYLDRHHHPSKTGSSCKTYRVLNEAQFHEKAQQAAEVCSKDNHKPSEGGRTGSSGDDAHSGAGDNGSCDFVLAKFASDLKEGLANLPDFRSVRTDGSKLAVDAKAVTQLRNNLLGIHQAQLPPRSMNPDGTAAPAPVTPTPTLKTPPSGSRPRANVVLAEAEMKRAETDAAHAEIARTNAATREKKVAQETSHAAARLALDVDELARKRAADHASQGLARDELEFKKARLEADQAESKMNREDRKAARDSRERSEKSLREYQKEEAANTRAHQKAETESSRQFMQQMQTSNQALLSALISKIGGGGN
jgi:flagellar biosynthesis GTPase FlhF